MSISPYFLRAALTMALLAQMPMAEAAKRNTASAGQEFPSTQIADLTPGECKRLGGFTEANSRCKSGTTCITITIDHVEHSSCITEMDQ